MGLPFSRGCAPLHRGLPSGALLGLNLPLTSVSGYNRLKGENRMNLTKEQLDAVQKGGSVRLSENGTEVVVVRADVFDRLRQEAGLDDEEVRILAEIADLPEVPRDRLRQLAKKRTPPPEWFEEKDDLF
jgi:hypothetical protein